MMYDLSHSCTLFQELPSDFASNLRREVRDFSVDVEGPTTRPHIGDENAGAHRVKIATTPSENDTKRSGLKATGKPSIDAEHHKRVSHAHATMGQNNRTFH